MYKVPASLDLLPVECHAELMMHYCLVVVSCHLLILLTGLTLDHVLKHGEFSAGRRANQEHWLLCFEMFPGFILHKVKGRLEDFQGASESVNLIYYDAFAPSKQPDVWSVDNFKKCYSLMQAKGMLVSYCANGQFKRDLKTAGFMVKPYPGALGKREMTRAHKLG